MALGRSLESHMMLSLAHGVGSHFAASSGQVWSALMPGVTFEILLDESITQTEWQAWKNKPRKEQSQKKDSS